MILVIGGSSFIGVHVIERLRKDGFEVATTGRRDTFKDYYSRLNVPYYKIDITDKEAFNSLPQKDIDAVILLAALLPANTCADLQTVDNAADYFEVNTIGTINVLEYCRKNRIGRMISTSSYADVSKAWKKNVPLTEEEPRNYGYLGDHAAYVFSKNAASDIMEYYNQQHGMSNAVFRLPPVFGVGPHGSLHVNGKLVKSGIQIFIDNAIKGDDICIYGDKTLSRDIVYVKDVAQAFSKALKSDEARGLYNITSGNAVTLEEQARAAIEVFSKPSKKSQITYAPDIKNSTPSFLFSIEKAHHDFGYTPGYPYFKDMLQDYKNELGNKKYREIFGLL